MAASLLIRTLSSQCLMIFVLGSAALADPGLYERARKEGLVLVYSSFKAAEMNTLKDSFEKRYPGVKVEHLRSAGARLMQRILAEHRAGNDMADTVLIKGEAMHVLGQKGILAKFDPLEKEPEVLDKMFKHPQNFWTTVYLGVHSIT